jgi:aspartate racemase
MKKKLGIIGGMGSHAAAWLFNKVVALSYGEKDQENIEILLHNNTAIPDRSEAILYMGASPLPELMRSIEIFNSHDIDFAVMACITAHYYKPMLSARFRGHFFDPIELTAGLIRQRYASVEGLRVGVIASTGALRSGLFQAALAPMGIEVVSLEGAAQEQYFMQPIYMEGGAKSGNIRREAVDLFARQIPLLKEKGADIIVGACSEVPLLLDPENIDWPYISVFDVFAQEIVDACYARPQIINTLNRCVNNIAC